MLYCNHCGTENTADSKFCRNCGQPPFGHIKPARKPKFPFLKTWLARRGNHPLIGTLGMVLCFVGFITFCSKPSLGMTILSLGFLVLIYAGITGNLKLFR
jgi:zinc-ribbon domain